MALRVEVEINFKNNKAQAVALANSGYESEEAEILLPASFAKNNLGFRKGKKLKYITAGGKEVTFLLLGEAVIRVLTEDKKSRSVAAKVLVSRDESEIIMSDKLAADFGIELLDFKKGSWRFSDDPAGKERLSKTKHSY